MIKSTLTTLIAAISPFACDGAPSTPPARPAQVIYVPQDYDRPFIAEPGDRVILIMNNDSDELTELNYCEDRGGELTYNPFTDMLFCEDIDF